MWGRLRLKNSHWFSSTHQSTAMTGRSTHHTLNAPRRPRCPPQSAPRPLAAPVDATGESSTAPTSTTRKTQPSRWTRSTPARCPGTAASPGSTPSQRCRRRERGGKTRRCPQPAATGGTTGRRTRSGGRGLGEGICAEGLTSGTRWCVGGRKPGVFVACVCAHTQATHTTHHCNGATCVSSGARCKLGAPR